MAGLLWVSKVPKKRYFERSPNLFFLYIPFKNRVVSQESQRFRIFTVRKRSCGKVMFSQACVKNSVQGRRRCTLPWADTLWQTPLPLCRHPPPTRAGRYPTGQTPVLGRQTSPWADPPRQMAAAADGTHPTGMHSWLLLRTGEKAV